MTLQIILIAINALLSALGPALVPRRQRYFLNPVNTFWLTFLYFSVLQPATNLANYNRRFGEDNVTLAIAAFTLSAICLYFGTTVSFGAKISRLVPTIQNASKQRLDTLALILLIIGVGLTLTLVAAYGGWTAYIQRNNLRMLQIDVSDYLTLGPQIAIFAVLIGLATNIYYQRLLGRAIYGTILLLLLVWFVVHGSRSMTIQVIVIIIACIYAPRMRRPNFILLLLAGIVFALFIGFIGAYRPIFTDISLMNKLTFSDAIFNSIGFILRTENTGYTGVTISEDFGMAVAVMAFVPDKVDYNYGYMFLQLITQWVPHSFWPEKIYPDGEAWHLLHSVANTSVYRNAAGFLAGPAPTIVGKYFYSFGWAGVAVGSFLSGVMIRAFWSYTLRTSNNVRTIFMSACAPIGFMEANNPSLWLTFWLPSAGLTLFLVFVMTRVVRRKKVGAK